LSNWGRIAVDFWRNEKAEACSDAAIGVWARANSFSRDKRTSGFISYEDAGQWDEGLVAELVEHGLWDRLDNGYVFHDYMEHNGDIKSKASAARMVGDVLGGKFPLAVEQSLSRKVEELLNEGQDPKVLKEAVKLWGDTPGAGVALLPYLVADAIRKRKDIGRDAALREAWKTGDTRPLEKFGLVFTPPDLPLDITTVDEAKAFMFKHKREWIEQVH
jgi:hypothetical protein